MVATVDSWRPVRRTWGSTPARSLTPRGETLDWIQLKESPSNLVRLSSGMEPMNLPAGYLLPEGKTMQDILRLDAELLASEGLDPGWAEPGPKSSDEDSDSD